MEGLLSSQLIFSEGEFQKMVADNTASMAIDADTERILYATSEAEKLFHCVVKYGLNGMPYERLIPSELRPKHDAHAKSWMKDPHPRTMGEGGMIVMAQTLADVRFRATVSLLPLRKYGRLYVVLTVVPLPEDKQ